MRASINVEFTDEELRDFAEDGARRLAVNVIRDMFKGMSPSAVIPFLQVIGASAAAAAQPIPVVEPSRRRRRQRPSSPTPSDVDDFFAGRAAHHSHADAKPPPCAHVAATKYQEEGWLCCACTTFNNAERAACRQCEHERCDGPLDSSPGVVGSTDES